ncbi:MAG: Gldg family protein, partial [Alphaproteobacteria bacterium]|nr:Gldg family protein [Alphaproteobacteria bacterium]
NLEGDFNIFNVTAKTYEISPLMDMLILINPKNLPAHFIYAVDQYIVNGGKVLLFWDLLTENQSQVTNLEEVHISKLFNHWGIIPDDKFTDDAKPAEKFMIENGNVKVKHAVPFAISNQMFDVEPLLTNGDKYVGALLVGTMTSAYANNPFEGDKKVADMAEHIAVTLLPAQVAVIGDVDLIEDYLWADEKSVSKNPYSVIAKNKNIDFIRLLIEKMLNIKEYTELPVQNNMENPMNIAQQINAKAYEKYADEYDAVSKELKETQQVLLLESNGDNDRLQTLLQTDELGLQMAELEKKFDKTVYAMKKIYDQSIYTIIFLSMFLFPLLSVTLLWMLFFLKARFLRKKIRGFFA